MDYTVEYYEKDDGSRPAEEFIFSQDNVFLLCRSAGSCRSATAAFHTAPAARTSSIPIPMKSECLFTFPTSRRASCA